MPEKPHENDEIGSLLLGQRFLLWAIRQWVWTLKSKDEGHATLRDGFRQAGLEDGYFVIDELLAVLGSAAIKSIDIRCPRCPGISADEKALIAVIAALQKDDTSTSTGLLEGWLPPSVVWLAQRPAAQLARLMEGIGLELELTERVLASSEVQSATELPHSNVHAQHGTVQ